MAAENFSVVNESDKHFSTVSSVYLLKISLMSAATSDFVNPNFNAFSLILLLILRIT